MTDAIDQGCQREQEDRDRALAAQAAKPSCRRSAFATTATKWCSRGAFAMLIAATITNIGKTDHDFTS